MMTLTLNSFQLPCCLLFYLVSLFGGFDFGWQVRLCLSIFKDGLNPSPYQSHLIYIEGMFFAGSKNKGLPGWVNTGLL